MIVTASTFDFTSNRSSVDDDRLRMSEANLQTAVLELAQWFGYETYHTRDSRGSRAGFPDLVLWHGGRGRTLFVELKSQVGNVTTDQGHTLRTLAAAGNEVRVWRPSDLLAGTVEEWLRP